MVAKGEAIATSPASQCRACQVARIATMTSRVSRVPPSASARFSFRCTTSTAMILGSTPAAGVQPLFPDVQRHVDHRDEDQQEDHQAIHGPVVEVVEIGRAHV